MVKAEKYKGIEFVRISQLPEEQANQIVDWSKRRKITILTDSGTWRDCVQYKDYKSWYENYYRPVPQLNMALMNESKPAPKRNFSIGVMRLFHSILSKN